MRLAVSSTQDFGLNSAFLNYCNYAGEGERFTFGFHQSRGSLWKWHIRMARAVLD